MASTTQIAFVAGVGIGLVGGGQLATYKLDAGRQAEELAKTTYVQQIERLVTRSHEENVSLKQQLRRVQQRLAGREASLKGSVDNGKSGQTERCG